MSAFLITCLQKQFTRHPVFMALGLKGGGGEERERDTNSTNSWPRSVYVIESGGDGVGFAESAGAQTALEVRRVRLPHNLLAIQVTKNRLHGKHVSS